MQKQFVSKGKNMSHNQDVNIVLWSNRGETLGEALKKLRRNAIVMSATDGKDQNESESAESEKSTVLVEQVA